MTPSRARELWLERWHAERDQEAARARGDGLRLWYEAIHAGWGGPAAGPQEEDWEPEARAFLASATDPRRRPKGRAGGRSPGGEP